MNLDEKISKYFTLRELVASNEAKRLNISNLEGLTSEKIANLKLLAMNVLDKITEYLGKKPIITSCYRSEKLNEAVGGAKTSQHLQGCAVDVSADYVLKLKDFVKDNMVYDQMIYYKAKNFIHISFVKENNRRQYLEK